VHVANGRFEVRDHGPGIDPDDRPYVFDRFYRAPAARSLPGSGLGLAITKQVVDAHGGRVSVEGADGGGARVGFELPELPTTSQEPEADDDTDRSATSQ
jgi:signal transduction histidine kinase